MLWSIDRSRRPSQLLLVESLWLLILGLPLPRKPSWQSQLIGWMRTSWWSTCCWIFAIYQHRTRQRISKSLFCEFFVTSTLPIRYLALPWTVLPIWMLCSIYCNLVCSMNVKVTELLTKVRPAWMNRISKKDKSFFKALFCISSFGIPSTLYLSCP